MRFTLHSFICLMLFFSVPQALSSEHVNFKNISIYAERVTLDETSDQLSLSGSLKIAFGDFTIIGESGLLDFRKDSLLIVGSPASLSSIDQTINGTADRLIIFPNLSMEMVGNAELFSENRSIFSQNITYQINAND